MERRSTVWGTSWMEQGGLQCGVPVEWSREVYSVGYRSNATGRSTVWSTGRMEQGGLQYGVLVEWNREVFSVGYRSNGTGRSTVWGTGRMEQGGLQCGVPVEWNMEVYSVGYRSNGAGRFTVWGTSQMQQGGLQCGVPVEWNREVYSVGYRSNGTWRSTVWGTGRIADEILGWLTVLYFSLWFHEKVAELYKIAICQMVRWFPPYHGKGRRHWTPFVIKPFTQSCSTRDTTYMRNPFFVLVSNFATEIAFISFFHHQC